MDFNPEDAHQYFEGVDYPASKEDLISAAEANGAPDWLVDRIGTLGRDLGSARVLQLGGRRGGAARFSSVDLTTTVSRMNAVCLNGRGKP